jgi:hypothetical protein
MLTQFMSPLPKAATRQEKFALLRQSYVVGSVSAFLSFILILVFTAGRPDALFYGCVFGVMPVTILAVSWPWVSRMRAELRAGRKHADEVDRLQGDATQARTAYSAAQRNYDQECARLGVPP